MVWISGHTQEPCWEMMSQPTALRGKCVHDWDKTLNQWATEQSSSHNQGQKQRGRTQTAKRSPSSSPEPGPWQWGPSHLPAGRVTGHPGCWCVDVSPTGPITHDPVSLLCCQQTGSRPRSHWQGLLPLIYQDSSLPNIDLTWKRHWVRPTHGPELSLRFPSLLPRSLCRSNGYRAVHLSFSRTVQMLLLKALPPQPIHSARTRPEFSLLTIKMGLNCVQRARTSTRKPSKSSVRS